MSLISIYQVLVRLFGNNVTSPVFNGSREENGVGKMSAFTPHVLKQIREMGFTHIWYTGLIEHARCQGNPEYGIPDGNPRIIKGKAGSPYAICDYYDIDPDLADSIPNRQAEFDDLVRRTHEAGLKMVIDFVPNHVARQYHSDVRPEADFGRNDHSEWHFSPLNDFYYTAEPLHLPEGSGTKIDGAQVPDYEENPAKVTGNDQFSAWPSVNDWYETVKLNYGVDYQNNRNCQFEPHPVVWQKMTDILCYWAARGVDAFRCDMAEMVPVEFWQYAIAEVKKEYPDIQFIAEIYGPAAYKDYIYRGGFDYLYDKVGLYDTLRGIICHGEPASNLTRCWQNLGGIDSHMLRFLENHDEQRIASRFFAGNPRKAIPAMIVAATLNQGAVMVYFGQEVGEPADGATGFSGDDGRTTIFDYSNVPEFQKWYNGGQADGALLADEACGLRDFYYSLMKVVTSEPCFTSGRFYDLMWVNGGIDTSKVYAFLRYTDNEAMLVVVNFDHENGKEFRLRVPDDAVSAFCKSNAQVAELSLTAVFGNAPDAKISPEQLTTSGVEIKLQPQSGVIYKVVS
ncbi:MAG: alpha amylase C-terminal domain-containing protein [Salinivirgaceae bacterium]|nr:alpha amylase C-terminal domain-containing protein [Salinivirgaceae bacterium]